MQALALGALLAGGKGGGGGEEKGGGGGGGSKGLCEFQLTIMIVRCLKE